MISIIFIVIFLIIGGFTIFKGAQSINGAAYNDAAGRKQGRGKITRGIVIVLVGLIVGFIQPYSLERIDAGNKGIVVNLSGSERGVANYQYKNGWVVYNSWSKQVLEYPVYQQHIEYDDQEIITLGGFPTTIKPSFNYSLKAEAIGDMFVNLRLDVKAIEQGWLKNAIIGAVNDVANTWEVDSIFSHRQAFEHSIVVECNKRLSKWFDVSQLRTNITPPEALKDAIIQKTKAIQQAQASEQQALSAIADGKRKVAVARADSAEMIINASASAKAIQLKQEKISQMYIEYVKACAWDGKLPSTIAGGSGTFLNIK